MMSSLHKCGNAALGPTDPGWSSTSVELIFIVNNIPKNFCVLVFWLLTNSENFLMFWVYGFGLDLRPKARMGPPDPTWPDITLMVSLCIALYHS
jgi:hypothetical protein